MSLILFILIPTCQVTIRKLISHVHCPQGTAEIDMCELDYVCLFVTDLPLMPTEVRFLILQK